MREKQYTEDEIDLKELFNAIWQKRLFIAIFTFVVTTCAGVYAYNKTSGRHREGSGISRRLKGYRK